jgi:hypothetical protein
VKDATNMNTPDICRAPTDRSPEIRFDPQACSLSISGASFPEDGAAFYGPVLTTLEEVLKALQERCVTVRIALNYFNSSSAKALMNLFIMLDDAAQAGNQVTVNWFHAPDDDTMKEFGEEFAEDVRFVRFNVIPSAAAP